MIKSALVGEEMARFAKTTLQRADKALSVALRAIDLSYSHLINTQLGPPFFASGWGNFPTRGYDHEGEYMREVVSSISDAPKINWKKVDTGTWIGQNLDGKTQKTEYAVYEASIAAGASPWLYSLLPPECHNARVRLLMPVGTPAQGTLVHLPATGDHTLGRRTWLARRLLHHGIASVILEGPFYGARTPAGQSGSRLRHVSDLIMLGRVTIEEGMVLACWAEGEVTGRVGITGLSMGGVHAAMAASLYPRRVACIPCLAPHSAAPPYVLGPMASAIAWDALRASHPPDSLLEHCASHLGRLEAIADASSRSTATHTAGRQKQVACAPLAQAAFVPGGADRVASSADASQSGQDGRMASKQASSSALVDSGPTTSLGMRGAPSGHAFVGEAYVGGLVNLRGTRMETAEKDADLIEAVLGESALPLGFKMWDPQRDAFRESGPESEAPSRLQRTGTLLGPLSAELYEVLLRYTDITQFPVPKAREAIVMVGALDDMYVHPSSVNKLASAWGVGDVRWVQAGHVSAFVSKITEFQMAMRDGLARL